MKKIYRFLVLLLSAFIISSSCSMMVSAYGFDDDLEDPLIIISTPSFLPCGNNVYCSFSASTLNLFLVDKTKIGMIDFGDFFSNDYIGAPWMDYSAYNRCEELNIEEGITFIGDWAFLDCASLISAVLPKSISEIGSNSFYWCKKLKYVSILNNLCTIENGTFHKQTAIYGYKGSTAEAYCKKNGNQFYALDEKTVNGLLLTGEMAVDNVYKLITGFESGMNFNNDIVNLSNQYELTSSSAAIGTGTVITMKDKSTGVVVDTYQAVVSGDLNGDGSIDVFDQSMATAATNFEMRFEANTPCFKATDLNEDNSLDVFDTSLITAMVNFE